MKYHAEAQRTQKCKKKPFTKKEAQTILNYIKHKDKHDKRRKEKRIYQCPVCDHYHLTKWDNYYE